MANCPFYKTQTKYLDRKLMNGQLGASAGIPIERCWCQHPKHSPMTRGQAGQMLSSVKPLICGGDRAKCQVPAGLFDDQV